MHQEAAMKGDDQVIQNLNETLKNELTAVNQYWLHYRMLDNWGVHRLAEFERHESIDEMKHADSLAERILFLDDLPNFQALGRLRIGENVEEILKADLEAEHEGAVIYRNLIVHSEKVRDFVTRDLARSILEDEEKHIDFIETQFDLIGRMGLENYIQLQSESAED
jgi:bacterioferritin